MSVGIVTLTAYSLVWPVLVAVVMTIIGRSFFKEWKEAHDEGISLV
ncbi:putative transporter small subunit [Brevibacterium jeotgali]|uniref:Uncharacterized protein n=1 Tax=Brevibacterium jeotgali TaxID=1262550 RepID=A0A2H1L8K0_9MICO|nr:putative transporter small subunit [Brevibacterium jeotgali]TWC02235.1 hypothetical protein FB108_0905 [Brevibacterium jeotgali]SMY12713.1 hypothetical protein BJEO58_02314 [Brevibacterium jeotgali]